MSIPRNFGKQYLRLTLEVNQHVDGFVDAYFGPPEIKADVESSDTPGIPELLDRVASLRDEIPAGDPVRAASLRASFRAMDCALHVANGEDIPFLEEANRLYDISPVLLDEAAFSSAQRELDAVLPPGKGTIADRLAAWRKDYEVRDPEKLLALVHLAREITRSRTAALFDLVDGEDVQVELVSDQPWGAYNWFKGNATSLIEFNTDIPVSVLGLVDLFAHEGYPGHHTEHQLKEKHLYHEKGYLETSAALLYAPSAVIAEGIATTAAEIILPGMESHEVTASEMVPMAEAPAIEAAQLKRISDALRSLRYVTGNAALLYFTGKLDEESAVEYIQEHAMATGERARKSLSFVKHYRSYIYTYTMGYDLIEAASGGDKLPLFQRLLVETILPSQLAAMAQ